ncbi:MAG: signal peptidase [Burkholderiales bacterium]|jgi:signal peptidase II|nr:signal peptidase [Burkholderiales bacterium]MCE3267890.1 signal peptidase [Burkholderiales bacterium]
MQIKFKWAVKCNIPQSYRFLFLGSAFIIAILDQITKYYARHNIMLHETKRVMQFWNWTLNYNQGAAFSFLADQGEWPKIFFGVIALIVSMSLVYYLLNKMYSGLSGLALSFILGGAMGNLVDRIVAGKVTDFIQWHYETHYWPAFNVADSFITVGVTLLIIESIFFARGKE